MDKKIIIITAIVVVSSIILLGGYFLWISFKKPKAGVLDNLGTAEDITNSATRGVLPSLRTNPLEDKPDINPAGKANPFAKIKINPF